MVLTMHRWPVSAAFALPLGGVAACSRAAASQTVLA